MTWDSIISVSISIHTSPKGGDPSTHGPEPRRYKFQSTPPRREVTSMMLKSLKLNQFQSTPPRREVTCAGRRRSAKSRISIHTSPKGGDQYIRETESWHWYFNPHLPEGR